VGVFLASRGYVEQPRLLVGGSLRYEAFSRCPRCLPSRPDGRHGSHDEIALAFPARQVEPAQQRLPSAIQVAIQCRHEHMIEFEGPSLDDRHDLHRVGGRCLRLRVQLPE